MCGILRTGHVWYVMPQTSATPPQDLKHADTNKQSLGMHAYHSYGLAQEELTRVEVCVNDDVEDEGFDAEEETLAPVKIHHPVHAESVIRKTAGYPQADDSSSVIDLVALLKACGIRKDLHRGTCLHDDIIRRGLLENNVFVSSALISMYAKCGALQKAQGVFDDQTARNVVSWTALITGYVQHGYGKEAMQWFEQMQLEGFSPNAITFSCVLKACGQIGDLENGKKVHAQIKGAHLLEKDIVMATSLVDMYAKCGALEKAQDVFDDMPIHNEVSWNALITGYAQQDRGEEALQCFQRMQFEGIPPNSVTLASIVKACGSAGALEKGQELHALVVRARLVEKDLVIGTALVDMYAKCGALEKAQEVFDGISAQDIVIWNALISGYDQHGHGEEALSCFEEMQLGQCSPDLTTYTCILNACGNTRALDKGQEIHALIVREALLKEKIELANALVDMYAKCGVLEKAQEVFDELSVQDVVSWNAVLAGYAQHGLGEKAIKCYEKMQLNGFTSNAITFACILKACGSIGALEKGQEIHAQIAMKCLLEKDVMVGTALVDMYAKCGAFGKAVAVFKELPSRSVVLWNALITGYIQHGHCEEAIDCFKQIQSSGFSPDVVTFTCILKACGSVGAAHMGQVLHAEVVRHGLSEMGNVVAVALLSLYASCGMLEEAHYLFVRLPVQDVVSWGALLGGYAQLGNDEAVFSLFDQSIAQGLKPNSVILAVILNVCSHRGLLDKGQMYLEFLSQEYGIIATLEHHTSLIDLFGRAGHLDEAVALAEKISCSADLTMWHTLLNGCQKWGNMRYGKWAFENAVQMGKNAVQMGKNDAAVYISLSNIYASTCRIEDTRKIRLARREPAECSCWVDTTQTLRLFSTGDRRHPESQALYINLDCVSEETSTKSFSLAGVSQGICIDVEKNVFCDHSEKLAISCALVNVSNVTNIRIVKNTRMCRDCHHAASLISRINKCSISIKDANRYHLFENGECIYLD